MEKATFEFKHEQQELACKMQSLNSKTYKKETSNNGQYFERFTSWYNFVGGNKRIFFYQNEMPIAPQANVGEGGPCNNFVYSILTDFKNACYLQIVRRTNSCIEQQRI